MKKVFINFHLFIIIPYPVRSNSQIGSVYREIHQLEDFVGRLPDIKISPTILPDLCRTYDIWRRWMTSDLPIPLIFPIITHRLKVYGQFGW